MSDSIFLQRLLADHYNLSGITISPAPRGFVARTFIAEHPMGRYFGKLVPVSRYSAHFEASLPVLTALSEAGITRIPQVIPTVNGGYSVTSEDGVLALFTYVPGEWTFHYDFEKYVALIATIHRETKHVPATPAKETFALPFVDPLNKSLQTVLSFSPANECEQRLQVIIGGLAGELQQDIANAQQWGERLRACHDIEWVITHGDGPGNILKDAHGGIYLIDWDDVLLAPRERDTWFHMREPGVHHSNAYHGDEPAFLGIYRRICPGYQVNRLAVNFYLYRRYLDDLEGFINRIVEPRRTLAQKQQFLALLEKDCLGWLRPWIRRLQP